MTQKFSLKGKLHPRIAVFLEEVGRVPFEPKPRIFLVGGLVRDVLLGIESPDIDLLVEGDGIAFAKYLRRSWSDLFPTLTPPEHCVSFKRYGTAKLLFGCEVLPGVSELDFASTRAESYPVPGSVPEVRPAGIEEDLRRRDFSINAIAVGLSGDEYGRTIDLFNGFEHLQHRQLVVLHDKSFVDDPVRLIRGARFIARFDFAYDGHTQKLADAALEQKLLATVSKRRLFDELKKALCDEPLLPVVLKLRQLGLLQQLLPQRAGGEAELALLSTVKRDGLPKTDPAADSSVQDWQIYLACLCACVSSDDFSVWLNEVECPGDSLQSILRLHELTSSLVQA